MYQPIRGLVSDHVTGFIMGTIPGGCNPLWVQSWVGTIPCWCNPISVQYSLGAILLGVIQMGAIPFGGNLDEISLYIRFCWPSMQVKSQSLLYQRSAQPKICFLSTHELLYKHKLGNVCDPLPLLGHVTNKTDIFTSPLISVVIRCELLLSVLNSFLSLLSEKFRCNVL